MSEVQPPHLGKKVRLGRGLGSLLGSAIENEAPIASPEAVKPGQTTTNSSQERSSETTEINEESQIWKVPIERLIPNKHQPRRTFAPEALAELAASIKEKGILQPIVARRINERSFEIIAGERRWRAAQIAGQKIVPVILRTTDRQETLELAIIENVQREDLNPLEEAEAYDQLISKHQLTQQQVADKIGKDRVSIANALRLLTLPKDIKEYLRNFQLSPGHAKVILALPNPQKQLELAKKTIEEKLSVRALEKLVIKAKSESDESSQNAPTVSDERDSIAKRLVADLANDLQKILGTRVDIDYSSGKGKVQMHFYSDAELSQLVERLRSSWQK